MNSRYTSKHCAMLPFIIAVLLAVTSCGSDPTTASTPTLSPDRSMVAVASLATETARLNVQVTTLAATAVRQATEISSQGAVIAYLATQVGPQPVGTATPIPTMTPYSASDFSGTHGTPMPLQFTPTPSPQLAAPQMSIAGYPPDTRVGIPILDAIIEAVLANDQERLRGLIHYAEAGCTLATGMGGPPKCKANEMAGTLVWALPFLGHEGWPVRREEVDSVLPSGRYILYAAYRDPKEIYGGEKWWLTAKYGLMFVQETTSSTVALLADDSGIVRMVEAGSPEMLLNEVRGDFILPPIAKPK